MEFTVNEINIVCTDGDASLRFYCDILGFELVSEEEGCWHLLCGKTAFLLMPLASDCVEEHEYCTVPSISVDLVVEDLDKAKKYLEDEGVRNLVKPAPNKNRFFIKDPNGLVFGVLAKNRIGTICLAGSDK